MIRTVLAHVTGVSSDLPVLETALRFLTHGGHIECFGVVADIDAVDTQIGEVGMGGWIVLKKRLEDLEREDKARMDKARATLMAFCRAHDISLAAEPDPERLNASWREDKGDSVGRIVAAARYNDLLVIAGGTDCPENLSTDMLGEIVVRSGHPVVLAPEAARSGPLKTIAIAWKDSAESARAVAAAIPLLESAERIEIVCAEEGAERSDPVQSCESMARYLRWHGLKPNIRMLSSDLRSATDAVMDVAHEISADLLVMGAYGHSRMRELVFGGFTQRVLKGVDLPVLLWH